MSPRHQEIKSRCFESLQNAGLLEAIEAVLPHVSYDGSTAILVTLHQNGVTVLIEGPEEQLPAIVLAKVQQQTEQIRQVR